MFVQALNDHAGAKKWSPMFTKKVAKQYDDDFTELVAAMQRHFDAVCKEDAPVLVSAADSEALFEQFLGGLPDFARQPHNCDCCREWFRVCGIWVAPQKPAGVRSVFFDTDATYGLPAQNLYKESVRRLAVYLQLNGAEILGPANHYNQTVGMAVTGSSATSGGNKMKFEHFYTKLPSSMLAPYDDWLAIRAKELESVNQMSAALINNPEYGEYVQAAETTLLSNGYSEKDRFVQHLQHILAVYKTASRHTRWPQRKGEDGRWVLRGNPPAEAWLAWRKAGSKLGNAAFNKLLVWALVEAHVGGHKVKIADGLNVFRANSDPEKYRMATAAPKDGAITALDQLIAREGLESAFKREVLPLAMARPLWIAEEANQIRPRGGFARERLEKAGLTHKTDTNRLQDYISQASRLSYKLLDQRQLSGYGLPATYTERRFSELAAYCSKVGARELYMSVPEDMVISALTGPVDRDAGRLLYWDKPDARNQAAWYTHSGWAKGGEGRERVERIRCITTLPPDWGRQDGEPVGAGARADNHAGMLFVPYAPLPIHSVKGACIFAEFLSGEYHQHSGALSALGDTFPITTPGRVVGDPLSLLAVGYDARKSRDQMLKAVALVIDKHLDPHYIYLRRW
jgi:hypothetical protein